VSSEFDDERLLDVFGVHETITFVGYLNMKSPMAFSLLKDETHEQAAKRILFEKSIRL
jgi:hypothetical protein